MEWLVVFATLAIILIRRDPVERPPVLDPPNPEFLRVTNAFERRYNRIVERGGIE